MWHNKKQPCSEGIGYQQVSQIVFIINKWILYTIQLYKIPGGDPKCLEKWVNIGKHGICEQNGFFQKFLQNTVRNYFKTMLAEIESMLFDL